MISKKDVVLLALRNIRIVGYGITGCSECPFSEPHSDVLGNDINIADPDEGHYDCRLLCKHEIWGENPVCTDKDWQDFVIEQTIEPSPNHA